MISKSKLLTDKGQAWFWSKGWQEKEHRAEQDKKTGRTKRFKTVDEAVKWLKS